MSKILVIEAHRMLQQAIALALFPEHEVKFAPAIPEASGLKGFDVVIVDPRPLDEPDGAFAQGVRAVQDWKVPTVWLQGSAHGPTPQRKNLIALNTPIEREDLLSALAECVGTISKEKRLDPSTRAPAIAGDPRSRVRPTGVPAGATESLVDLPKSADPSRVEDSPGAAAAHESEVIELLEIVEEGSESEIEQAQQKN
jgi:hypothetical protein